MPDYMFLLESRLSPEQHALLERVQELARSQDLNLYLTGGAVRDLISGQPIRDLDFTVEGNPVRMVRELEKGGAKIVTESERLRYYEMVFAGDVDGSIAAARDDVYSHPGAKPEVRFAGITEDLRRRDFSINAIAISLNVQSRGLLLDPTNGLADLERQEVRALSIHAFTNRPIRLIRILRYCARMGFKMESRTQEWFDLALQRGLHEKMDAAEVGEEIRALTREENPIATLKLWESQGLLDKISSELQRRKPDYDSLNKLARVRGNLLSAGLRPRLQVPVAYYLFSRLKPKEAAAAMRELQFRPMEMEAIAELVPEAQKIVQVLKGRKTNTPREAYAYISSLRAEMIAFIEVELPSPPVLSKFRNYFQKWRPLRSSLPVNELSALGIPRGPQFDKIMEQIFEMQLRGRARTPEERVKIFRQLAGIKDEPVKKPEKEKKKRKELDSAELSKSAGAKSTNVKQPAADLGHSAAEAIGAKARAKHDKAATAAHAASKHGPSTGSKSKAKPAAKKSRTR
jgi:tRNA nucleotidyltransferase (CCA-adding enzyme)